MKRLKLLLSCLALLVCAVTHASTQIDDLYYDLDSITKTASVVYSNTYFDLSNVVIPSTVTSNGEKYTVTEIKDGGWFTGAFYYCTNLTSITLPSTLKNIGNFAFEGCTSLAAINIPPSVTRIGAAAIKTCTSLTTITIPSSVTNIDNCAFQGSTNLHNICFLGAVPTTGTGLFLDDDLTEITLCVQAANLDAFKSAATWKDCGTIRAFTNEETLSFSTLAVNDTTTRTGTQIKVPIRMNNLSSITAFQFDLYLPTGTTVAQQNGTYLIDLAGRATTTSHTVKSSLQSDGAIRVVAYSANNTAFTGQSGPVLNVTLNTDSTASIGNKTIWMKNITFADINEMEKTVSPISATLTIKAPDIYTGTINYYLTDNTRLTTNTVSVKQGTNYTLPTGSYTSGNKSYPINSVKVNSTAYTDATYAPEANFTVDVYLGSAVVSIPDNSLYINDTTFHAGKQIVLPIRMKNSDNSITAIKTDLYLPSGFTIAKDSDGYEMIELGTRTTSRAHDLQWLSQSDGAMRFLCTSLKLATFKGNDGAIINVTINIADTVANGNYPIYLKNSEVTNTSSVVHKTSLAESQITIKSYKLGDVNDDGEVNTGDYVSMASYLLGSVTGTFIKEAADLTGDGDINTGDIVYMAGVLLGSRTLGTSSAKARFATGVVTDPATNNIQIIPFSIEPNEEKTINIEMNNPDKVCTAILFNLFMPDGIAIEKDADGLPLIDFGSRTSLKKHTIDTNEIGGATRVLIASIKLNTISGTSGPLVTVTIKASADLKPGVYTISLKNMEMTSTDTKVFKPNDYSASVFSGDLSTQSTLPALNGNYTADGVAALNGKIGTNASITSVDLTNATDIVSTATLTTANANTLFYLPDTKTVANTDNVVTGTKCTKLLLSDNMPFAAPKAFTAASASYSRNAAAPGWYSVCLPYAAAVPSGVSVEKYASIDKSANTITFTPISAPEANIPYIFKAASAGDITFEASNAEVPVSGVLADGSFTGTFSTLPAGTVGGKYALKADGSGFALTSATAYVSPFRAYLNESSAAKAFTVVHSGADGIAAPTNGLSIKTGEEFLSVEAGEAQNIMIASVDGRIIAQFALGIGESRSFHLASGIYTVNRTKVLVK